MNILKLAQYYYRLCFAENYSPANIKTKVLDILDDRDKIAVFNVDVFCTTADKDKCYVDIYLNKTSQAELRRDSIKNKIPLITNVLNAMWKNVEFIIECH